MTSYDYDIGVIGGGAAGLTVSAGAARLGAKTLLVEREPVLGGDCLHYGCVPSKTLIKTAHVRHLLATCRDFGLPAVALGPVDFGQVRDRIQAVIRTIQQHDSVERFNRLGVTVRFGQAEFSDEHSLLLDGRRVSARFWVIATGSSPAVPPIPGLDRTSFITNRELFSLDRLPGCLAILGAGPIAIEMAQAFRRLGSEVHVIQRGRQILSREDPDIADCLMAELKREGVHFHLGVAIRRIGSDGQRRYVVFDSAAGRETRLTADRILVATGRLANTADLGLGRLGVEHGPQGIVVDRRLRTSQSHIFAAGDVIGPPMFTHAAGYEAGVVVTNSVLRLPRRVDYTLLPWCTYTHPELASVGLNEKRATEAGIRYSVWREEFVANDRALTEGEGLGQVKLLLDRRERPIGVQIIGPQAGELLGEWIAVTRGRVRLATLATAVHPYPTLAEINQKLAGRLVSDTLFSPTVRKALRLLFGLQGGMN